jgi:uncharacterized repeat protein (TIGR03803 family)
VVYKLSPSGQETVLYSFKGVYNGARDGANPYAGVVMDSAGYLYGTTYEGGAGGSGTVYKVGPSGKEAVLFSFGRYGTGTGFPAGGGVILDAAGNIYGTGGVMIFKLDPAGHFTQLADLYRGFPSGLTRDASGNLYFATQEYPGGNGPMARCLS